MATNITTLAPSPIFQLSDRYGLCKAKEQREPRVKGLFVLYILFTRRLVGSTDQAYSSGF